MLSRLERNRANSKMARLNIANHILGVSREKNISIDDASRMFIIAVRAGTVSEYLSGAAKIADPKLDYLNNRRVARWAKALQRDLPEQQKPKAVKTRDRSISPTQCAEARKTVIDHVHARKRQFRTSLTREIDRMIEKLKTGRLPPYLVKAIGEATARSPSCRGVSITKATVFRWNKKLRDADGRLEALKPKVPEPKPPYANDNRAKNSEQT